MLRRTLAALVLAVSLGTAAQAQQDSVLAVSHSGTSLLRVNVDGNVGIGISDPTQRLTVRGGVQADSLTVGHVRLSNGNVLGLGMEVQRPSIPGLLPALSLGGGPLRYFRDVEGIVHFTGTLMYVSDPVASETTRNLFLLAEGYRPEYRLIFRPYSTRGDNSKLTIDADGTVSLTTSALSFPDAWSFDGTTFLATH